MSSAIACFNRHGVTSRYNSLLCVLVYSSTRKHSKSKKVINQSVILVKKIHIIDMNQI